MNFLLDKTGRKLKEGQVVDVMLIGSFQGHVMKIVENPIQMPGGHMIPPHVIIGVQISPMAGPTGRVNDVYIMTEQDATQNPNLKIVQ